MAKKAQKFYEGEIPFDHKGNQLHYPESWKGLVWLDNYQFVSELRFTGFSRGRSAAYALLEDPKAHTYTMFLSDLDKVIQSGVIDKGIFHGKWTFCKRGMNFGITPVTELP